MTLIALNHFFEYEKIQKGGVRDSRDKGLSHFYQSYQMFFTHADTELRRLAEDWKKNNWKTIKRRQRGFMILQRTLSNIHRTGGN